MNDAVDLFILKINNYIDKYYKCLLVKGLFIFLATFFLSFLSFSLLSYLFVKPSIVRLIFLLIFIALNVSFLVYYVFFPTLRLLNILPRITLDSACRLLQNDNPTLKDTLTNIIELLNLEKSELVNASITQKIASVKSFDFNEKLNYLPANQLIYTSLLSLVLFFAFLILAPKTFITGSHNLFHFSAVEQANFVTFYIDESNLVVEEGADLSIIANVRGYKNSDFVFVNYGGNRFLMKNVSDTSFSYIFKNVNNSFSFSLSTEEIRSKNYNVQVLKVPRINNYRTNVYYPRYVNKHDTVVENQNILIVPQGTSISQFFSGSNIDSLHVISLRDSSKITLSGSDTFLFKSRILRDENYSVEMSNENMTRSFINFKFVCIPDAYPEISVSKFEQQSSSDYISFDGFIKDDYGFEKLLLFANSENSADTFNVPILANLSSQRIFYNYENSFNSDITDKSISFYFEVYDNDKINGSKVTRSQVFDYTVKSIYNQVLAKEEKYDEIFRNLELSKQLSSEIQSEIAELRKKMIDNNLSDWEKQQMLQQIDMKTNQLQDLLKKTINTNSNLEKSLDNANQLLEKQNLISEMLNSLLDDELKQILKELSELASEKAQQHNVTSEDLKKDLGNFEKSLDKNLELLRKIKMEETVKQLVSNLDFLSEKQKNLNFSNQTDSTSQNLENQSKFFDDLHKQYNQLMEDNKSLERPYDIDDFSQEFNQIDSLFNAENQSLDNNDEQNFNKTKQENSDLLKQLSDKLNQKMEQSIADADAEVAEDLRQVLDNLFEISFNQERIITDYEHVNFSDPLYQERILEQSQLVENYKIVRDSLYNLSRRSVFLGSHISKAAFSIEDEMVKSCLMLQERNTSRAVRSQRESLKYANDMILLLSESLKNVENSANSSGGKPLKKRKQKPSDQKQSLSDMRNAQEQLKNQMRDLLNQMKEGDQSKNNADLVKQLIQNELYQQMLDQMMYNSDIDGQTAKLLQEVKNLMEKTHTDLANKKLSIQTVMRQQNIVNKLLEAENAETEREQEERREAITAKNIHGNRHENWQEDITFEKNMDVLKQTNLKLNSFYKSKFDEYLNSINGMSNE